MRNFTFVTSQKQDPVALNTDSLLVNLEPSRNEGPHGFIEILHVIVVVLILKPFLDYASGILRFKLLLLRLCIIQGPTIHYPDFLFRMYCRSRFCRTLIPFSTHICITYPNSLRPYRTAHSSIVFRAMTRCSENFGRKHVDSRYPPR